MFGIKQLNQLVLLTLIGALISACGVPGSGSSNNFGSSSRDEGDPELNLVNVAVTVEATPRMLNRTSSGSQNIITFDSINCSSISVVQLNFNFQELSSTPDLPNFTSKTRASDPLVSSSVPGCRIEFVDSFEPRVDAAIRVEFPNQEVLYAPLRRTESEDQSIVVSFGSHLALERFFAQLNDSIDLSNNLPCRGSNPDCETQHRAKARLLSFISETARLYEYKDDIQASQTAAEALALLRSKSDIMTHIDTAVREITRSKSPIAKGTVRESYDIEQNADIVDGLLQTRLSPTEIYNSVLFGIGLIEDARFSQDNKLSTITSQREDGDADSNLPRLTHNAFYLDFRYDDILPDIPVEMSTLRFKNRDRNFFDVDAIRPDNRYSFLTAPEQSNGSIVNGTHLSTQGFFLNDRAIAQAITERPDSSLPHGYDYNPVYYKLYRINEYEPDTTLSSLIEPRDPDYGLSPTWFTGSGYGQINVFDLTQTSSDPLRFERDRLDESHFYFTWEIHGLRAEQDLRESDINGLYDVVEFSVAIDDDSSNQDTILARAETVRWSSAGTGSFSETQPTTHYRTWELVRDRDNNVVLRKEQTNPSLNTRSYDLVETNQRDDDNNPITAPNGLITLDGSTRSRVPLGHVSDNGEHMAFALDRSNTNDAKRGLLIASRQRTTDIQLTAGTPLDFTLSGNYLFMDSNIHRLASVNESRLSISTPAGSGVDCDATLTLQSLSIDHTIVSTDPSDAPSKIESPVKNDPIQYSSTACTLNDGQVELQFTVDAQPLTLRGFAMNEDGALGRTVKQINLLWLQDDALGLVFAQLDQDLNAEFDN